MSQKKVVIISTSANALPSGTATGLWLEELASPYYLFKDAGFDVTVASVKGGEIPVDEASLQGDFLTPTAKKFQSDEAAIKQLKESVALASLEEQYDAYYLPGGHGAAVDFPDNETLQKLLGAAWDNGKIVSSVCHGPIGLVNVKSPKTGKHIVEGKRVTGFSNTEEEAVGKTKEVPELLEDGLKRAGGDYSKKGDWEPYAIADGKLILGQNPSSSEQVGELVVKALK